jgi:anti-sigma-K factor RskA
MSDDHRHIREQLGAFALGVFSETERTAIQAHLDGCPDCRAELAQLRRIARRLDLLQGEAASADPPAPSGQANRLFGRLAAERRRRSRGVAAGIAGAAAAVLILGVVLTPSDPPPGRSLEFSVVPAGVSASAELRDWGWGTQMYLHITGLPPDQRLAVWLEQPDGTRVSAGTFTSTGGELRMMLGAATRTRDAVALGVSDEGGSTLLRAPLET